MVSFKDFLTLKEMFASYKKVSIITANVILYVLPQAKEGEVPDLSFGLTITPLSSSTNGH